MTLGIYIWFCLTITAEVKASSVSISTMHSISSHSTRSLVNTENLATHSSESKVEKNIMTPLQDQSTVSSSAISQLQSTTLISSSNQSQSLSSNVASHAFISSSSGIYTRTILEVPSTVNTKMLNTVLQSFNRSSKKNVLQTSMHVISSYSSISSLNVKSSSYLSTSSDFLFTTKLKTSLKSTISSPPQNYTTTFLYSRNETNTQQIRTQKYTSSFLQTFLSPRFTFSMESSFETSMLSNILPTISNIGSSNLKTQQNYSSSLFNIKSSFIQPNNNTSVMNTISNMNTYTSSKLSSLHATLIDTNKTALLSRSTIMSQLSEVSTNLNGSRLKSINILTSILNQSDNTSVTNTLIVTRSLTILQSQHASESKESHTVTSSYRPMFSSTNLQVKVTVTSSSSNLFRNQTSEMISSPRLQSQHSTISQANKNTSVHNQSKTFLKILTTTLKEKSATGVSSSLTSQSSNLPVSKMYTSASTQVQLSTFSQARNNTSVLNRNKRSLETKVSSPFFATHTTNMKDKISITSSFSISFASQANSTPVFITYSTTNETPQHSIFSQTSDNTFLLNRSSFETTVTSKPPIFTVSILRTQSIKSLLGRSGSTNFSYTLPSTTPKASKSFHATLREITKSYYFTPKVSSPESTVAKLTQPTGLPSNVSSVSSHPYNESIHASKSATSTYTSFSKGIASSPFSIASIMSQSAKETHTINNSLVFTNSHLATPTFVMKSQNNSKTFLFSTLTSRLNSIGSDLLSTNIKILSSSTKTFNRTSTNDTFILSTANRTKSDIIKLSVSSVFSSKITSLPSVMNSSSIITSYASFLSVHPDSSSFETMKTPIIHNRSLLVNSSPNKISSTISFSAKSFLQLQTLSNSKMIVSKSLSSFFTVPNPSRSPVISISSQQNASSKVINMTNVSMNHRTSVINPVNETSKNKVQSSQLLSSKSIEKNIISNVQMSSYFNVTVSDKRLPDNTISFSYKEVQSSMTSLRTMNSVKTIIKHSEFSVMSTQKFSNMFMSTTYSNKSNIKKSSSKALSKVTSQAQFSRNASISSSQSNNPLSMSSFVSSIDLAKSMSITFSRSSISSSISKVNPSVTVSRKTSDIVNIKSSEISSLSKGRQLSSFSPILASHSTDVHSKLRIISASHKLLSLSTNLVLSNAIQSSQTFHASHLLPTEVTSTLLSKKQTQSSILFLRSSSQAERSLFTIKSFTNLFTDSIATESFSKEIQVYISSEINPTTSLRESLFTLIKSEKSIVSSIQTEEQSSSKTLVATIMTTSISKELSTHTSLSNSIASSSSTIFSISSVDKTNTITDSQSMLKSIVPDSTFSKLKSDISVAETTLQMSQTGNLLSLTTVSDTMMSSDTVRSLSTITTVIDKATSFTSTSIFSNVSTSKKPLDTKTTLVATTTVILSSSLVTTIAPSNLNNENKLTMPIRIPLSQNITSPTFRNKLKGSLQQLYVAGNQAKRKRRAVSDPDILIDSLMRRNNENETVDVVFFVIQNNSAISGNEARKTFDKLTLAQMDNVIGFPVLSKPIPVIATTNTTETKEKTELALWILVIAITAPIIFVLLLCNIICFIKYRAVRRMKLQPSVTENNNSNNAKPFKQYEIFQAKHRSNKEMAPDLKSAWNEIDTDKLIDMDGDPLYSLVKRSPSKRRNRRHQSTYAVKQKEIDEERSKTPSSVIHEKELDFENALAGKLYLATRFSEKLQVDPMFNNTGVRFRLNVLQDKQTSVNSRNKFLPPLDVNTMKHSSLNKDIFDGSEDNNKLLIANENEIVDDNDERLTEQEKVVMKEREMLEKIRNKERMRTREKAKFERKLKKMSSKVDIMENKTSGEMSTPLIPEVMYKKRSTKKKGARRKITMNSISPSESNMETDNESQNDRKSNQRQTPSNIDNMGNSYDLNDISTFRPFSSPFHTHNAVSPYPLAPAFPMAATSLYQHVPFQQSYDLFRQPTFDDRAQMTLNSTLNASWNPKNETDKSGFVPMILPNGRCQPRSAVRLVAENELELLEKAQQRARRKMQYVLQKSVSESTNISMSEC